MPSGQRGRNFGGNCHFNQRSGDAVLEVVHRFASIENERVFGLGRITRQRPLAAPQSEKIPIAVCGLRGHRCEKRQHGYAY